MNSLTVVSMKRSLAFSWSSESSNELTSSLARVHQIYEWRCFKSLIHSLKFEESFEVEVSVISMKKTQTIQTIAMLMLLLRLFIEWVSSMITTSNNLSRFHSKSEFNSCLSPEVSLDFRHFFWAFDSCRFAHVWDVVRIIRKTLFIIWASKNSWSADSLSKTFRSISIEFCRDMFLMNSW